MKKIKYWFERLKRFWKITKIHFGRYRDDIRWEMSHPYYYAKRIHNQKDRLNTIDNPWVTPPLSTETFPFKPDVAKDAMDDVNRWIVEEQIKNK